MSLTSFKYTARKGYRLYTLNFNELAFEIASNIREQKPQMITVVKQRLGNFFKEMGMRNMTALSEGESVAMFMKPGSPAVKEMHWVGSLTKKHWQDMDEFDAWLKKEKERLTHIYNMTDTLRSYRIQEIVHAVGIVGMIPFILYVAYLTFDRSDYTGPIIIAMLVMLLGVLIQQFEMARRGAVEMERRILQES